MLMSLRNEAACRVSSFTLVGFIAFHEKAFKLSFLGAVDWDRASMRTRVCGPCLDPIYA